jgi:signal transduction histidine kinase
MAGERVHVFISSPGDVDRERRAAAAVVRRLDREFRRFFAVEPFLWENEPRLGSGHFQDEIDPTKFDVVVLILWSRLGTYLPERTAKREYRGTDGRVPVTGTEWEYEHARAHADATGGAPALLVFRNCSPAPFSTTDLILRAQQDAQLRALDRFWQRHFHDQGVFLTAFTDYSRLEEFDIELTKQLRRVLEEFIRRGWSPAAAPAITWFESPFRGLEAYDFRDSPIFYGRDAATRQAVEQLAANAAAGTAFLLVLGASGSGKSSLVRAEVLPELAVENAIPGVRAWRRVLFRPSASPGDLFAGFAWQIVQTDPGDPGAGLAEIVSDYFPLEQLARHLRDSAAAPAAPIQLALGQVAAKLKDSEELHRAEQVRLVVVVDQLEELFTERSITAAERERFILMLAGLARSSAVWVIATMRSDFWHRVAELPLLAESASGDGRLDLWPPSAIELADIIRQPAAAAGLRFERDHGVGLDEQIAVDAASAPGVLPLLSYTLEALYRRDVERADSRLLLWESYRALGGLHGAIARRADDVVAGLRRDDVDDRVVARVLRRLVSFDESEGGRVMARSTQLTDFAEGTPERRLVEAFLRPDIRLLVAEGDLTEARLRVAHEALLTHWDRARRLLAEDAVNLARWRRLEEAERRWQEAEPEERPGLLLRPGLELNEAEALVAAWADEVDPALRDYIVESSNHELRRKEAIGQLTGGVAHDFNNLLTAILGNLELLRVHVTDAAGKRLLSGAVLGAERGAQLTGNLLAPARRRTLRPEIVNPNHLISEFSDLMRRALGEAIQLRLVLSPAAGRCQIDPAQFQASLLNLVANARDAMPEGGVLTIESRGIQPDAHEAARSGMLTTGRHIAIAVRDTGHGMAPEVLEHAFEPFYTTKDVGRGSGLGLSQVYGFVMQSGGHVEITSRPGSGTEVTIYLPLLEQGD